MQATAWVLDVSHRARRLACEVPPGTRPLAAVHELVGRDLALSLGDPLGVGGPGDAPRFLFLHPRRGEGPGWEPLASWALDDDAFRLYAEAMLGGWTPPARELDVFFFGDSPELAAKLAHFVVKGRKRGTTGWIDALERDGVTIPHPGLVSIVTDGFGYPACAIQTERVDRIRFRDVDAARASIEGEGDGSLEDWREGHRLYFECEARRLGFAFTEDALLCFAHFRVLAVLGRADGP
jgi:uncharacterized protein YhfF